MTEQNERSPLSPRSTSCIASPYATDDAPCPPYSARDRRADGAEAREATGHVERERERLRVLLDDGLDLGRDVRAQPLAERALVVRQQVVDPVEVEAGERGRVVVPRS